MVRQTRRRYLCLVSTGFAGSIAGCANNSNSESESPTVADTEPTIEISPTESPTTTLTPTATTTPPPETPTETPTATQTPTPTATQTPTTSATATDPPRTILTVSRDNSDQSTVYFDVEFDIPNGVSGVEVTFYYAAIDSIHGFEQQDNDNVYRWDGETPSPTLSFVVDIDAIDYTSYDNTYVATNSWVFGPTPDLRLWWYTDNNWRSVRPLIDPDYDRISVSKSSPGVVGGGFFYLGPHEIYTKDAHGQVLRLVVPDEATLVAAPSTFLNAITDAFQYLVGTLHESVSIFSPPDPVREGGLAKPDAGEFWVHAESRLKVPESTWFHEYVHLRQEYTTKTRMQWIGEGSADYYATLFAFVQNLISEETAFEHFQNSEYKSAVLSKPSSWSSDRVPYSKGESVLFVLDTKIREKTGDESWLGNVSYQMNQLDETVSYPQFRSIVVDIADSELGNWVDKYVTTSAWPEYLQ